MAMILRGSEVAEAINNSLAARVSALTDKGTVPALAILRVGDDENQISYEKSAEKRCRAAGIAAVKVTLEEGASQETVISSIEDLNNDSSVHGVLILRPLPKHLCDSAIRAALFPEKDVDGITDASLAGVFTGTGTGYAPCTAEACMRILNHYSINPSGKRAVVIGRSLVVGKPAAIMLMEKNATVTVCHSKTVDINSITRDADIIIAATGQMESLGASFFSPGQTVIDVGINWNEAKGKLCGDVRFEEAEPIVAAITPVPGGVGTVTSAILASHVVSAAEKG